MEVIEKIRSWVFSDKSTVNKTPAVTHAPTPKKTKINPGTINSINNKPTPIKNQITSAVKSEKSISIVSKLKPVRRSSQKNVRNGYSVTYSVKRAVLQIQFH